MKNIAKYKTVTMIFFRQTISAQHEFCGAHLNNLHSSV